MRAAEAVSKAETWGPVCRGFSVGFPDGGRGRVERIRVTDAGVALLVATGARVRLVAVDGADVELILPRQRRIVVGSQVRTDDAAGVDAAGGIIRMSPRHSMRIAGPPEGAD